MSDERGLAVIRIEGLGLLARRGRHAVLALGGIDEGEHLGLLRGRLHLLYVLREGREVGDVGLHPADRSERFGKGLLFGRGHQGIALPRGLLIRRIPVIRVRRHRGAGDGAALLHDGVARRVRLGARIHQGIGRRRDIVVAPARGELDHLVALRRAVLALGRARGRRIRKGFVVGHLRLSGGARRCSRLRVRTSGGCRCARARRRGCAGLLQLHLEADESAGSGAGQRARLAHVVA